MSISVHFSKILQGTLLLKISQSETFKNQGLTPNDWMDMSQMQLITVWLQCCSIQCSCKPLPAFELKAYL